MGVLDTLNQIPWFPDVAITLATVGLLVGVYLLILQPRVYLTKQTRISGECPDRWKLNVQTGMCEPSYRTECQPFHHKDRNMQNMFAQCEFATRCGTNWGGACQ